MHAVLSLPAELGNVFGASHKLSRKQQLDLRDSLLEDMEEAHSTYRRFDSLCWVLAVLGVAFHDGMEGDKQRILVMVDSLMTKHGVYSGPSALFDRFQTFWSSGKTTWDSCFYKPTHVMA